MDQFLEPESDWGPVSVWWGHRATLWLSHLFRKNDLKSFLAVEREMSTVGQPRGQSETDQGPFPCLTEVAGIWSLGTTAKDAA